MIVLEKQGERPSNPLLAAGFDAEAQMAFYLRRAFGDATDVFVFHDLRLSRNGERAQMDHLVFHRFGFVIVESKSITADVSNRRDGSDPDFHLRQHSTSVPVTQNPLVSAPARPASASAIDTPAVPLPVAAVARPRPVPSKPAAPAETYICSHCQSTDLHIVKGPYSYYFKCYRCKGNTPIDFACPTCRRRAKISKAGGEFSRACGHCGTRQVFFVQERE